MRELLTDTTDFLDSAFLVALPRYFRFHGRFSCNNVVHIQSLLVNQGQFELRHVCNCISIRMIYFNV
ncbi:hypothetical protein SCHPADRAFT_705456 [Schizopora paradoxa]|uniref:Uncharacterized protein n=1 Tax=Schizopora paradoxa TaxID=27342 RepID=A0A0H2R945_9AGAM|nr:hypothetical protein SCHPADRAFT_705456 [Schizopora paradoxa]